MQLKTVFLLAALGVVLAVAMVAADEKKGNGTEDSSSSSESIELKDDDKKGDEKKPEKKEEKKDEKKKEGRKGWRKQWHSKGRNGSSHNNISYIPGKYVLRSDPKAKDFQEYLKAMEFSDECIEKVKNRTELMVSLCKNESKWTVQIMSQNKTVEHTFESGKELEADLGDGRIKSTTLIVNEGEHRIDRVIKMGSFDANHAIRFTRRGFFIFYRVKDVKAKQYFSRVDHPGNSRYKNLAEAFKSTKFGARWGKHHKHHGNGTESTSGGEKDGHINPLKKIHGKFSARHD